MRTPTVLLGFGLVAALGLIDARPGQAACLSIGDAGANNCATFDGQTSFATQTYSTLNLFANQRFQIGFYSTTNTGYSITSVQYSTDGNNYISLGSKATGSSASPNYFNPLTFSPITSNPSLYIQYQIDGPVAIGDTITSRLLTNNSGNTIGGILVSTGNFAEVDRESTAVPAPLPLLGAAAAFARVKGFRNNSKILSRMG